MNKFKIGDRVTPSQNNIFTNLVGCLGTVKDIRNVWITVKWDDGLRPMELAASELQIVEDPDLEKTEVIEQPSIPSGGTKHDGGKVDLSLLSSVWIIGVGRVLTKGKRKYSAHNWRQGLEIARLMGGVFRHLYLFLAGIDYDVNPNCPECKSGTCEKHTGEHHLSCASCGLMFISEMLITRPDLDDRYKLTPQAQQLLIDSMENQTIGEI